MAWPIALASGSNLHNSLPITITLPETSWNISFNRPVCMCTSIINIRPVCICIHICTNWSITSIRTSLDLGWGKSGCFSNFDCSSCEGDGVAFSKSKLLPWLSPYFWPWFWRRSFQRAPLNVPKNCLHTELVLKRSLVDRLCVLGVTLSQYWEYDMELVNIVKMCANCITSELIAVHLALGLKLYAFRMIDEG